MSGDFYSGWALHLAEPAARALALALVAALALIRTKDASLKFLAWKGVLAAALAMPLLGALVPSLQVVLPRTAWATLAPATAPRDAQLSNSRMGVPDSRPSGVKPAVPQSGSNAAPRGATRQETMRQFDARALPARVERPFPWQLAAVFAYLVVAGALLARLVLGWLLGKRLLRAVLPVQEPRLLAILREQAAALGLRRLPALAASDSVAVPVTLGVLAPVIVLPASSAEWDERKARAVLAHELSHVARRDALTFLLSKLHRCFFWFSPLAWWLDGKLRVLAEQASDDWALERTADRIYYAELLLGFWKDLDGARLRIRFEGASMAKEPQIHERVERILSARSNWSKRMRRSVAVGAALVAGPVVYFAAALNPAVAPQEPAPPPAAVAPVRPVAPSPATAPAKPPRGIFGVEQMPPPGTAPISREPALAPAPPCGGIVAPELAPPAPLARVPIPPELGTPPAPAFAPVAPLAPGLASTPALASVAPRGPGAPLGPCPAVAPTPMPPPAMAMVPIPPQEAVGPEPPNPGDIGFAFQDNEDEFDEGEHYVIVSGDHISMSGNSDDARRAKKLRSKIEGDYIWFHRDEQEYVITDAKTVEQARALFAPQEELGRKQEELGKLQEELGAQQEELGKHMEEIRVKLPDLRRELKRLQEELSDLDTPRTQEQLAELQAELGEMQARIGEQMAHAGGLQGELGAKQGVLGAKQGELGRRQGELGREQGRLAREANRKMKSMLDDSITRGIAKPAPK